MGKKVLITGGAGFIGTNLAHRLLELGTPVTVFDNLSRAGSELNLEWLRRTHPIGLSVIHADIRDSEAVRAAVAGASAVFHFAAQVAVTTSLDDPRHDFAVNAGGTLNVLEAVRAQEQRPPVLFTSTNKVYGALEDLELIEAKTRYAPMSRVSRANGIGEDRPLDFHSPYGCSKGTADQYVLDYARSYGLDTVVFRMSCIYGPHQHGDEDEGWVAHFLIRALENSPVTLYGDGRQVRDVLFIEDLVDAFTLALRNAHALAGQAFNVGGGPENTLSLLELLSLIAHLRGASPPYRLEPWRAGDPRYFVSNFQRLTRATGWRPRVDPREGVMRLLDWLARSRGIELELPPAQELAP